MGYNQKDLFKSIQEKRVLSNDSSSVKLRETHISVIFLTGKFAYKFKKNLKLDFLDFTTLENRKVACENELKLNQRYAKELYLEVVPIYYNRKVFGLEANGEVVEYAVKMKQFNEDLLFSNLIKKGKLKKKQVLELTESIVDFHEKANIKKSFWGVKDIMSLALDNFTACMEFSPPLSKEDLILQKELTEKLIEKNKSLIKSRQNSHVKALHGDLHLGNICMYQGKPQIFDGIEFNEEYSSCDTIADLAFLLMDLDEKGYKDFSASVLNYYLELTDDYSGLALLNLYKSYRAMVRGKIACYKIKIDEDSKDEAVKYTNLSRGYLKTKYSCIIAIGGLSGSGKSTLAKALSESISAIIIRQDAIRKHIFELPLEEKADENFYSKEANERTEEAVIQRIKISLKSNLPIIVDSTFKNSKYRKELENFAKSEGLNFVGIWCYADEACIKTRLSKRVGDVSDANYEIYKKQKSTCKQPKNWERINTDSSIDKLVKVCSELL